MEVLPFVLFLLQITSKGYVSFDSPYYGQSMMDSLFRRLFNQAIVAPFWGDLAFIVVSQIIPFEQSRTAMNGIV